MTRQEHLLICLAEECSEVIQEISKILRFGLDDMHPKYQGLNRDRLHTEINDVFAIASMLEMEGIDLSINASDIVTKQEKVEKYIEYATKLGTIK